MGRLGPGGGLLVTVTRTRVPDRDEQGKPREDARRGRCHPLEAGIYPCGCRRYRDTQLPSTTERCVLNHHNWTGSFKMKRFEIFCSDPFQVTKYQVTHQPGEWPERYGATRASLDVAVRAGTEQTTPRGLDAAVSGFGGPCTLPRVVQLCRIN